MWHPSVIIHSCINLVLLFQNMKKQMFLHQFMGFFPPSNLDECFPFKPSQIASSMVCKTTHKLILSSSSRLPSLRLVQFQFVTQIQNHQAFVPDQATRNFSGTINGCSQLWAMVKSTFRFSVPSKLTSICSAVFSGSVSMNDH